MTELVGPMLGWYWHARRVWFWQMGRAQSDGWFHVLSNTGFIRPLMLKRAHRAGEY